MKKIVVVILLSFIVLAGCSANYTIESFAHIHGADYSLQEPYDLLVATHNGLARVDANGDWRWTGIEKERHDLMGFSVLENGNMIASGHPNNLNSDLENPLGIILSEDHGKTWEPIAFHGRIDFHMMAVHASNTDIVYAVDQHGSESGMYRSNDGGAHWEKMNPQGLSSNFDHLRTIMIDPNEPNRLMVGAAQGIFVSDDGGENWSLKNDKISMTAVKGVTGNNPLILAYLIGEQKGLMKSVDFGETWEFLNLVFNANDAAAAIAIHPTEEGVFAVATHRNHVYTTVDNGATWIQIAKDGKPL